MHWIDPDCLPETKGKVERFILNPHGEIDGSYSMAARTAPHWSMYHRILVARSRRFSTPGRRCVSAAYVLATPT